jgi:lysophospholipase L1-like esterase
VINTGISMHDIATAAIPIRPEVGAIAPPVAARGQVVTPPPAGITADAAARTSRKGSATTVTALAPAEAPPPKSGQKLAARIVSWWPWAKDADKPRVAFFGSSTMAGAGASRQDRRMTSLLSTYLGWEEVNAAKGGSLLSDYAKNNPKVPPSALQRWESAVAAKHPDRVLLMYGANDMHSQVPMSVFEPAVAELLGDLKTVVKPEDLMVVTPQPVLKTNGDRNLYASALEAGATAAGVQSINPGQVISAADMPEFSAPDGIHLNDQGHAILASYMAAKLADAGFVPAAPIAHGGNAVRGQLAPMAAGHMLIDDKSPLSNGEVRRIETQFTGKGTAVVGVVRPNGKGGFDLVYKTKPVAVQAGTETIDVPRWRVLEGDRLAVWADGQIVGGDEAMGRKGAIIVDTGDAKPMRDIGRGEIERQRTKIAIRAVDGPGAPLP